MSASPLCHGCKQPSVEADLFAVALRGDLVQFCPRCFYCKEIAELSSRLAPGNAAIDLATDGLGQLYAVVKAAVEEELATSREPWSFASRSVAASSSDHAAESESEGQGRRTRRRRESQG